MLLAIDQGTTGTACLVFDLEGEPVGRAYREFTQHFPRPGWVEHDAAEIWDVSHAVAGEALQSALFGQRCLEPGRMGEDERAALLAGWHRALERSRGWAAE